MEREEFEIEAQRIRPRLYQLALRYMQNVDDAEDVTQDVLLKLWNMRQQLDGYRSVEALAFVITKHSCVSLFRKSGIKEEDFDKVDSPDLERTPEEMYIAGEDYDRLMRLIDALPDSQQMTLRMKHIDGLEVSDIAKITGAAEVTVRTNLSRARKKIMEQFLNTDR
jgi:RNA polymerase sigma-70 factor (ECF subfamily)